MRRTLGAAAWLLMVAQGSGAAIHPAWPVPTDNPRRSHLDQAVDQAARAFFRDGCHAGLSLAVVQGARASFYDYGSVSRGSARLPTPRSIYEIASVTKTFTGALAARAVLEGRMSLDGDFRAYLPDRYPNLARNGRPITLRTLATHRSGLPRDIPDTDPIFAGDPTARPFRLIAAERGYDRARYLRALHGVRLRAPPGIREVYSNIGFKVIGFGLETAYGAGFETLMRRKLLGPLHLTDTGFAVSPASRPRLVRGYDRLGRAMPYHLRNAGAAYGLYSTPADMAKYARWQLDEGDPVVRYAHRAIRGTAKDGQALVWNLALDGRQRMLFHGGGSFGMSAQIVLYPDIREGFVMLTNDTCPGTEGALESMAIGIHHAL